MKNTTSIATTLIILLLCIYCSTNTDSNFRQLHGTWQGTSSLVIDETDTVQNLTGENYDGETLIFKNNGSVLISYFSNSKYDTLDYSISRSVLTISNENMDIVLLSSDSLVYKRKRPISNRFEIVTLIRLD